jgi:hypothetical protein
MFIGGIVRRYSTYGPKKELAFLVCQSAVECCHRTTGCSPTSSVPAIKIHFHGTKVKSSPFSIFCDANTTMTEPSL